MCIRDRDRINEDPKPPRSPRIPKAKVNAVGTFGKGDPTFNGDSKEGKNHPEIPRKENKEKDEEEKNPPVFKPNGPVKVLQRLRPTHYNGYELPPQYPMGPLKSQASHPPIVMTHRGNETWRNREKRYPLKERRRTRGVGYGKQYETGNERRGYPTYETDKTQPPDHNTAYGSQRQSSYLPTKNIGNEQGGSGGSENGNDKKKYRDTKVSYENESHEESDTEDSYEFEVTPQQLSQLTPGGGALKIKLSKKKPLKIAAGAPNKQTETISMELERNWGPKQTVPGSHGSSNSKSTLHTKGTGHLHVYLQFAQKMM